MRQMALRWAAGVVALLVTVSVIRCLPFAQLEWEPAWRMALFVPALAIINAIVGPIIKLLALPINCLTFGLFSFVVNSLLFWLAGSASGGMMNAWGALLGSVLYAILSTAISWSIKVKAD
jgi:putative membrane protein